MIERALKDLEEITSKRRVRFLLHKDYRRTEDAVRIEKENDKLIK